ncbi:hypothetical protein, partial [Enterococcus faecium]|uniref:hypothetical protein n=1 Tax=Enterococcus faecium TaxID=1352 RepID=UPI0021B0A312
MRNAQEIYTTGDLSFHLSRIKGLSSIFEGPINYTTFNNYGDGLNYFYPFLTIIPAVVFYGISNNLILSYVLYIWLLNICKSSPQSCVKVQPHQKHNVLRCEPNCH